MPAQNSGKIQSASKEPSCLEREALIAASVGDLTGVTAKPVGSWNRAHYWSVNSNPALSSNQAESNAVPRKAAEPVSAWKESAIHRKQLLAARLT